MVDTSNWVIQCDNCGKEYDIPKDIPTKMEDMEGSEQLVLEASPNCPYCHTINSKLATCRS